MRVCVCIDQVGEMRRCWLELSEGARVRDVLARFMIVRDEPNLNKSGNGLPDDENLPAEIAVGVFGQLVALDYVLAEGDRVEVYRPLTISPAERRRQRAAQRKRA